MDTGDFGVINHLSDCNNVRWSGPIARAPIFHLVLDYFHHCIPELFIRVQFYKDSDVFIIRVQSIEAKVEATVLFGETNVAYDHQSQLGLLGKVEHVPKSSSEPTSPTS